MPDLNPGTVLRPAAIGAHAFVVLGVAASAPQTLVVAWTTLDEECPDDECVLQPGDHVEIIRPSALALSRARLWESAKLRQAVAAGLFRVAEPLSHGVFQKLVQNAAKSVNLRREWKNLLPKF